jgi:hypothetical protein
VGQTQSRSCSQPSLGQLLIAQREKCLGSPHLQYNRCYSCNVLYQPMAEAGVETASSSVWSRHLSVGSVKKSVT